MRIWPAAAGKETSILKTLRFSVLVDAAALGVAATFLAACASAPERGDRTTAHADLSGLFGNTIVEYNRQNPEYMVKVEVFADGTYQASTSSGFKPVTTTGTWKEQDGKVCFTRTSKPLPGSPIYHCVPGGANLKVGDTWIERWPDGRTFKGRVVAGTKGG